MILLDTSIWVDHFRRVNATLQGLLDERQVLIHPFVIGEVALGNLARRSEDARLWTRDKRLLGVATRLSLAAEL